MKMKIIFFFLIFFCNSFHYVFSNINDKIVAKIGNEIITNYDIINEVNTILALSNRTAKDSELNRLQTLAYASLKKKLIKKREIKKYKITNYNQSDVNNYILSLTENLKLQNITLEDHFKKYGANYDLFIQGVITNFKWNSLIYSLYKKQLDVDEELIKSELNKKIQSEKEIKEFNLSEIVIENWDEEKLSVILKSIKENGFEKTAATYSSSVSSSQGGSIGWVVSKSISSKYLKEILKLDKTQISGPININNNIVIIKLNDKRTLNQKNLNLVEIENRIINKKKEEKLNIFSDSHYLDLEKKVYIEINE
tara:strand:+ start:120 stop:1049 length:930 start_codon:yes stop_codon:yes gene_type:complete